MLCLLSFSRPTAIRTAATLCSPTLLRSLSSTASEWNGANLRNVAIVAHVDHGKTTLVDTLLQAAMSSTSGEQPSSEVSEGVEIRNDTNVGEGERLMDSGDIERERGITITSKATRLEYKPASMAPHVINVVDTPGHADFSGEVDRILSMVDGVCLVVDAGEGPMSQTKYVLSRALSLGLKPIVVVNKVDREEGKGRIDGEVEMEVLELFDELGASEEQMDYPTFYASSKAGWITTDVDVARGIVNNKICKSQHGMTSLLDAVISTLPSPSLTNFEEGDGGGNGDGDGDGDGDCEPPFALAATMVGYDKFLGRTATGKVHQGSAAISADVSVLRRDGEVCTDKNSKPTQLTGVFVYKGVTRTELDGQTARAGDIVTITGVPDSIQVGDTLTLKEGGVSKPISTPPLAPPTLQMEFGANDGPLAGREGNAVSSGKIRERLFQETDNNVTLNVTQSATDAEKTTVFGRGELQLGILVEEMRREGYEFCISPPAVVTKICEETGDLLEPYEEVIVDVDADYAGACMNALTGNRKATMVEMFENNGKTRMRFEMPSRGLLGFGPEVSTMTRGSAVVNHTFLENRTHAGLLGEELEKGKLVSSDTGKATAYALEAVASRGTLFVDVGDDCYAGMVVGENSRPGDMDINCTKGKAKTNVRSVNKDEKTSLPPPKRMSVEELIGYMGEDEKIEATPKSIRLRKAELDPGARAREARVKKKKKNPLNVKKGTVQPGQKQQRAA